MLPAAGCTPGCYMAPIYAEPDLAVGCGEEYGVQLWPLTVHLDTL